MTLGMLPKASPSPLHPLLHPEPVVNESDPRWGLGKGKKIRQKAGSQKGLHPSSPTNPGPGAQPFWV